MPYYVVNAGRGRSYTHIMNSKSPSIPGLGTFVVSNVVAFGGGTTKQTLCGLTATRYVNVFTPSEASCRECKKRWQLAGRADEGKRPRSAGGKVAFTAQERNTTDFRCLRRAGLLRSACLLPIVESVFMASVVMCGRGCGPSVAAGAARGSTARGPGWRGGSSFLTVFVPGHG